MGAVRMLLITGSMGVGKTTVMAEASDLLVGRRVAHAAIDLDSLGIVHLPGRRTTEDLTVANFRAVWANYAAAGVDRLLIAAAVESRLTLDLLRDSVAAARIDVARLKAPLEVMKARVRRREPGMYQAQLVERVAELERLLDAATLEDFTISNDARSVTEVARELLARAGWL